MHCNNFFTKLFKLANFGVAIPAAKLKKLHRASAPGEAPATDTGNLVRNIGISYDIVKEEATIASRAEYSAALEFGTSRILPRPFMRPAFLKNQREITALLREASRG